MPSWQLHKKLEFVGRFQAATASEPHGLRLEKPDDGLPGYLNTAGYPGLDYNIRGG
jgi:hypothetical protein